ncbi:sulfotransferase [Nonomuraea sp. NPDC050404]|uniref:sulfotransferase family protein n=1 Tax=Nonomuraea sp. NPDC050404 TaxID=3155783 RepID=UPI003405D540
MSCERANSGVTFIGTASHSGSTLLGLMLGAHPRIFYAGEACKINHFLSPSRPAHKRHCAVCGPRCRIWAGLRPGERPDLYEVLSRRSGRPLVFDSSKNTTWIGEQTGLLRGVVPLRLIVLTRDGRGVVNSYLRKHPSLPADEHVRTWLSRMRAVERLAGQWPGPVHRVRYEHLTTEPGLRLREIARFLGVPYVPEMASPWSCEHHPMAGNKGTRSLLSRGPGAPAPPDRPWYTAERTRLAPDLRWRHELGEAALAVFEELAGAANRPYAWDEP